MDKIISRAEAKALGLNRFFTGRPCIRGHIAERRTGCGTCQGCEKERLANRIKTPEWKAYHANHYAANREERKEYARKHRKNNQDSIQAYYAATKAARAVVKAKWQKLNRAKLTSDATRRRAVKKNATVRWADRKAIDAFYAESARISKLTGIPHHVDHIVPLLSDLVCGLHNEFNLQVIPGRENQSKSNRWWPDMPGDEREDAERQAA